ncbi:MAG TPA: hypothetical protein VLE95_01600 [Chlamydiales bacterium]|nr:hypothetical protein [Chlamydiales bacterium]
MCLSIFLAQVVGLYLFLISLAMLVHQARFKKTMSDLLGNMMLISLTGVAMLIVGLLIVVDHNIWVADWPVIITIIGWILLLQGLMRLFVPDAFVKMSKDMQGKIVYTLGCWVRLFIGVYLIWAGFSQV